MNFPLHTILCIAITFCVNSHAASRLRARAYVEDRLTECVDGLNRGTSQGLTRAIDNLQRVSPSQIASTAQAPLSLICSVAVASEMPYYKPIDKYIQRETHNNQIAKIAAHSNGKLIAFTNNKNVLEIVSRDDTGKLSCIDRQDGIYYFAWHPKANILVIATENGDVFIRSFQQRSDLQWNLRSNKISNQDKPDAVDTIPTIEWENSTSLASVSLFIRSQHVIKRYALEQALEGVWLIRGTTEKSWPIDLTSKANMTMHMARSLIAYTENGYVSIMTLNENKYPVFKIPEDESIVSMVWSPHGEYLAIHTNKQLYIVRNQDIDGRNIDLESLIINFIDPISAPTLTVSWSPDGESFVHLKSNGHFTIHGIYQSYIKKQIEKLIKGELLSIEHITSLSWTGKWLHIGGSVKGDNADKLNIGCITLDLIGDWDTCTTAQLELAQKFYTACHYVEPFVHKHSAQLKELFAKYPDNYKKILLEKLQTIDTNYIPPEVKKSPSFALWKWIIGTSAVVSIGLIAWLKWRPVQSRSA